MSGDDIILLASKETKWKLLDFRISKDELLKNHSIWEIIWGMDIFINNIPIFKTLLLLDIILEIIVHA